MTKRPTPKPLYTQGKVSHEPHDYGAYMSNTSTPIDMAEHVILNVPAFPGWLARELNVMIKNWTADMNLLTLTQKEDGILFQERFKEWCQSTFEGNTLALQHDAGVKSVMVALVTGLYKTEPQYVIRKTDAYMEQSKEFEETRYLVVNKTSPKLYNFCSNKKPYNGEFTHLFSYENGESWIKKLPLLQLEMVIADEK